MSFREIFSRTTTDARFTLEIGTEDPPDRMTVRIHRYPTRRGEPACCQTFLVGPGPGILDLLQMALPSVRTCDRAVATRIEQALAQDRS